VLLKILNNEFVGVLFECERVYIFGFIFVNLITINHNFHVHIVFFKFI